MHSIGQKEKVRCEQKVYYYITRKALDFSITLWLVTAVVRSSRAEASASMAS